MAPDSESLFGALYLTFRSGVTSMILILLLSYNTGFLSSLLPDLCSTLCRAAALWADRRGLLSASKIKSVILDCAHRIAILSDDPGSIFCFTVQYYRDRYIPRLKLRAADRSRILSYLLDRVDYLPKSAKAAPSLLAIIPQPVHSDRGHR